MKKSIKSWETILKPAGYRIIEWNEGNWDIAKNNFALESYQAGKYAYTSDIIRLDVLNRFGGIYLDTDMIVNKPLDPFLGLHAFWSMQFANTISTSIIGSEPNNPFIKYLLQKYSKYSFKMILQGAIPETNNEIITKALIDYYPEFTLKNKKQTLTDNTIIFPKEFFVFPTFNKRIDYTDHLFTKTWGHDNYSKAHYLIKNIVHSLVGEVIFGKISTYRGQKKFLTNNEYYKSKRLN